ncbi:septum formation initiator [Croceicoccus sp. F390]|uniref:Septum formation initiator n=1 Tax=Croceicoccus esteveae TaxID=3075597 RepID=A0ABU2ZHR3_9SPHN|nr:septum formation initiator [Croceicoccus sp. F390]MDT0574952.1 septum formation initiator [Croceicoccus sp. F390]
MPKKRFSELPHMNRPQLRRRRFGRIVVICMVIGLSALSLVGPTGVLAWSTAAQTLEQRQDELALLQTERDRIANRVHLLDPDNADPDLVGELLRKNLNVAHPDEVVVPLN